MTNEKPLVSVIMITYNEKEYISQALDSVLSQKVDFPYEILIGDDASTDGTQVILKKYAEKYRKKIRLFVRTKNLGPSRNAYELLIRAKGKYTATCEGDDYWIDPLKLQKQVDILEENPSLVGCAHKFTIVDESGKTIEGKSLPWVHAKKVFRLNDFKGIYMPGQPSTFMRRNLVTQYHEDISVMYKIDGFVSDRTLMMLSLFHGNYTCLDDTMSCYRKSTAGTSVTAKLYRKNTDAILKDYNITCSLEILAEGHGHKLRFSRFKKILFSKACALLLLRADRSFGAVAYYMWKKAHFDITYPLYMPAYLLSRCIPVHLW